MANEGSTKATYSELERKLAQAREEMFKCDDINLDLPVDEFIAALQAERDRLRDELARVRGLLQHQWISVEERLPDKSAFYLVYPIADEDKHMKASVRYFEANENRNVYVGKNLAYGFVGAKPTHWQPQPDPPNFPQSSSLVPEGAESADIGKLETADKKGVEMGKVNRVEEKDLQIVRVLRGLGKNMNGGQFENFVTHIVIPLVEHHWPGSAETGGEKAAPLSDSQMQTWIAVEMFEDDWDEPRPLWEDLPEADRNSYIKMAGAAIRVFGVSNFPRPSQNQTVSSGVEGVHEGTTADKNGSREPEKLNNAQKCSRLPICTHCHEEFTPSVDWIAGKKWHDHCDACYDLANPVALVESSLSQNADLSAPTPPETTGLSVEPAEDRAAKEIR